MSDFIVILVGIVFFVAAIAITLVPFLNTLVDYDTGWKRWTCILLGMCVSAAFFITVGVHVIAPMIDRHFTEVPQ